MIPRAMRLAADDMPSDIVLACPGIVYRRDVIDRLHTGEPHQIDLWRVCRKTVTITDLEEMVRIVVQSAVPGRKWRTEPRVHPYTLEGLQIDVLDGEEWIEIGECGLVRPEILAENIPQVKEVTGLAMGLGLDRILMVRKGIPDIRYLRSNDPRIASQMLDLAPYREVSSMPAAIRDISLVLDEDLSGEELGDRVRESLGCEANAVEAVEILSQTSYHALPPAAIKRLGIREGQTNILVRIVLRALDRTLTNDECNAYRDTIYECLHQGSSWQWASKSQR
jgi:phenylalanyl-tRNA synthetase alpha chain